MTSLAQASSFCNFFTLSCLAATHTASLKEPETVAQGSDLVFAQEPASQLFTKQLQLSQMNKGPVLLLQEPPSIFQTHMHSWRAKQQQAESGGEG